MPVSRVLTDSLEDYLEAIYHLDRQADKVRVKQLAEVLDVRKSSVTVALRALAQKRLILYAPYGEISLTPEGMMLAEDIIRRHEILKEFLISILGVDEKKADKNACEMEHVLTKEVTERLIKLMEFIEVCPRHGAVWIERFQTYCHETLEPKKCEQCLQAAVKELKQMKNGQVQDQVLALSELLPGQKGTIVKIHHTREFRKRILEMGVTTGAVLQVERVAPLGDPIDIKIRGYHLSLRKAEAKNIMVKRLGDMGSQVGNVK